MRAWGVGAVLVALVAFGCSGAAGPRDGATDVASATDADASDSPGDVSPDATTDAPGDARDDAGDAHDAGAADTATDAPADTARDAPAETPTDATADAATDRPADTVIDVPADTPVDLPPSTGDGGVVGGACGDAACVGSNWAQWPMPNTPADVANGAPHPAMLINNGDDTVTDAVTGLMWQRTATITLYNRAEAAARCQRLRTGAHADWRVPSAIELASIINFDRFTSSIDTVAFPDSPLDPTGDPRVPNAYFGTTTVIGTAGWIVSFVYGTVSLDTTSLDRNAYLRCVRGRAAPAADTSAGRYDLSVAGTARDVKTGLTWQRIAPTGRRRLADATTYCATGTGLPGTGWRLPTVKELMTLLDFAKPAGFRIDETVFNVPTDISDRYGVLWSATAVAGVPSFAQFTSGAWSLYVDPGFNNYIDAAGFASVRCVR
jgi:hypothetical protein